MIVEVRASAVTGDRVIERVQFSSGSPTTQSVHFDFAVTLDSGYEHRVVRVYDDGHTEGGEWSASTSFSGILDVSEYRRVAEAGNRELDARQLY